VCHTSGAPAEVPHDAEPSLLAKERAPGDATAKRSGVALLQLLLRAGRGPPRKRPAPRTRPLPSPSSVHVASVVSLIGKTAAPDGRPRASPMDATERFQ
jgi:hypothetical protein